MSCVGLWRGLRVRKRFGLAIPTLSANSFTPIARTTLLSATCSGTPSSMDASRNSRANARSFRSSASPTFHSLLRLATPLCLQEIAPEFMSARHVLRLRSLVAADQQDDDRAAVLPEVNPIARSEHHTSLPDAPADTLVVAEVAQFKRSMAPGSPPFNEQGCYVVDSDIGHGSGLLLAMSGSDPPQLVEEVERDPDREASDLGARGAGGGQREPVSVRVEIELPNAGS